MYYYRLQSIDSGRGLLTQNWSVQKESKIWEEESALDRFLTVILPQLITPLHLHPIRSDNVRAAFRAVLAEVFPQGFCTLRHI